MLTKWTKLAGDLLQEASESLSNAGCNDWKWPADWTPAERLELARAMVADNVQCTERELTADLEAEAAELVSGPWGPPDWWVALYLAKQLQSGA